MNRSRRKLMIKNVEKPYSRNTSNGKNRTQLMRNQRQLRHLYRNVLTRRDAVKRADLRVSRHLVAWRTYRRPVIYVPLRKICAERVLHRMLVVNVGLSIMILV
jgi:hypothetical protein